jgi:hypothetical protein
MVPFGADVKLSRWWTCPACHQRWLMRGLDVIRRGY